MFLFPVFWWGLTSIKPESAINNLDGRAWSSFTPTLANYTGAIFADINLKFDIRQPLIDTILVASGAALLTLALALPAAYGLARFGFRRGQPFVASLFLLKMLPPIATIIPVVTLFRGLELLDTRTGLMLAHTALNLPLAILLLKSFFDETPKEVAEAASIDGANRLQIFWKIEVPAIKQGIVATLLLSFLSSWTEFFMSVFLTHSIQMLPVQFVNVSSWSWGFTSAYSTASLVPGICFILLIQKHLARGLTWGLQRS